MGLSSHPVAISDVQAGRIGEYLLAVYAMLTLALLIRRR